MLPPVLSRTASWKSDDAAEQYVRDLMTRYRDVFENHWLDAHSERGEFLPLMQESIPGQYGGGKGIDIFAIDEIGQLWVIEVSRGTPRGAARFKGGGKPVKYAGNKLQMSAEWRVSATEKFLNEMPQAAEMLRQLLHDDRSSDQQIMQRLRMMLHAHRKAIIIPLGAHFDAIETDIDFNREVYTCRFPSRLFHA